MKKFYQCNVCGNLMGMIRDAGVIPECCGQPMTELVPNSTDGADEKHVPVCTVVLDLKKVLETKGFSMQIGGGADKGNGIHMQIGNGSNVRGLDLQIGKNREHEKEALEEWMPVKLRVQVGEKAHPMQEDHYIAWIIVETDQGTYKKELHPDEEPMADFFLCPSEEVKYVYAFCNVHGLYRNQKNLAQGKTNCDVI